MKLLLVIAFAFAHASFTYAEKGGNTARLNPKFHKQKDDDVDVEEDEEFPEDETDYELEDIVRFHKQKDALKAQAPRGDDVHVEEDEDFPEDETDYELEDIDIKKHKKDNKKDAISRRYLEQIASRLFAGAW